jgi:four helix bundle protein
VPGGQWSVGRIESEEADVTKVLTYRELYAWQRAMDFAEAVYRETGAFPLEETYGLRSQVRRSSVSVVSNIAEGQGRKSTREFLHRLSIAHGSLLEAETQLLLSGRLGYLSSSVVEGLLAGASEVGRLVNGLYASLESKEKGQ